MYRQLTAILLISCILTISGCKDTSPIRVGFIGELTTRAAGLATNGRDGFLLAVEEVNAGGGINGRPVEGIIKDARMHKETALNAIKGLEDAQVSAIVGPMTSQTAVNILTGINQAKIPTVSPTASSNQLSGLKDYFFRVYYTNTQAAQMLAEHLLQQAKTNHIAAVYDLGNRAYTQDWVDHFEEVFVQNSQAKVSRLPFDLRTETLFLDLANDAIKLKADALLILANAVDTAMICQQLAKLGDNMPRFATGWSYSDDLLQFGGKSVEGMMIIQSANLQMNSAEMQEFTNRFQERFRIPPNFPAMHAYDATRLILTALEHSTEPKEVKAFLEKGLPFQGVQSDLALDPFGDLKKPVLHLTKINNGQFIPLK